MSESALILASASPRRAKILAAAGVRCEICKTDAEEISFSADPRRTVRENAMTKLAAARVKSAPDRAILAADTIVWFNERIYGKPKDVAEAAAFLRELSGNTHFVFTGVAYLPPDAAEPQLAVAEARVTFKPLSEKAISDYIRLVNPLDRAGAYDIDESGDLLIEKFEGEYENVMGLPLAPLRNWGLVAAPGEDREILSVTDLHVRYGSYEAVKGVSFTLKAGEILGIVGESGSGKSTIAKALMGLSKPYSGKISLRDGVSMQMIFQDAVGSLNPRMTVRQTLFEVLALKGSANPNTQTPKHPNTQTTQTLESLLEQVGLSPAVLDQYPREMSGGQCQRVSIARALACHSEVLIADEPVSALDVSVQARVLNLLRDLRRDLGLSIILIAHDLAVVKNVCDRVCVMEKGLFVDVGDTQAVFENPTSDYTRHLLSVVPKIPRF